MIPAHLSLMCIRKRERLNSEPCSNFTSNADSSIPETINCDWFDFTREEIMEPNKKSDLYSQGFGIEKDG